jgi:hypothetical protein
MPSSRRDIRLPILYDTFRGSGGLRGGFFTMGGPDNLPLDYVATTGVAQGGGSRSITLAAAASAADSAYNGNALYITAGTGSGQDHQRVTAYVGSTKVATVSGDWITTPDNTSTYKIVNRGT